jgi:S1-C subfamily serine protease
VEPTLFDVATVKPPTPSHNGGGWGAVDERTVRPPVSTSQTVPIVKKLTMHHALPVDSGVLVTSVEKGSPAERAGLRDGDILVGLGGVPIASVDELHRVLRGDKVGESLAVDLLRGTARITAHVRPSDGVARAA